MDSIAPWPEPADQRTYYTRRIIHCQNEPPIHYFAEADMTDAEALRFVFTGHLQLATQNLQPT